MNIAFRDLFDSKPPWEIVCIQAPTYEGLFDEAVLIEVFDFAFDDEDSWDEEKTRKLCGVLADAVESFVLEPFCAISTACPITNGLGNDIVIGSTLEVLRVLRLWHTPKGRNTGVEA